MVGVFINYKERVVEKSRCFLKLNAVLLDIMSPFVRVPLKVTVDHAGVAFARHI
jgi:hypothetical protein